MVGTIIGCIAAIVLYCIYDRKRTNKNEENAKLVKRLEVLEERFALQSTVVEDLTGRVDNLAENVRIIAEDVVKIVPVSGQNAI